VGLPSGHFLAPVARLAGRAGETAQALFDRLGSPTFGAGAAGGRAREVPHRPHQFPSG
jgi:hypothetical protein